MKCWYCGTTSFNRWRYWIDPWVEHAKRAPTCEFLLQKKGVEFARLITSLQAQQTTVTNTPKVTSSPDTLFISCIFTVLIAYFIFKKIV